MGAVRWLALGFSASLAIMSVALMILKKTITAEAWAMLLLAPIPAGFGMTRLAKESRSSSELVDEWTEDHVDGEGEGVGDPTESGFDMPVL